MASRTAKSDDATSQSLCVLGGYLQRLTTDSQAVVSRLSRGLPIRRHKNRSNLLYLV